MADENTLPQEALERARLRLSGLAEVDASLPQVDKPLNLNSESVVEDFQKMPDDLQYGVYRELLAIASRVENEAGFRAFYDLIHGWPMPAHSDPWLTGIFQATEEIKSTGKHKGLLLKSYRGSYKTTTITITFTAWYIGLHPERANLLIQVSDDVAFDNSRQIADIIENNSGFKLAFPSVVPNPQGGWGAGGYEVKRVDIPYRAWRELNSQRKDPTLIGVGYRNSEVIGKHPDGLLVVDDINDETNTASERELNTVNKIVTDTIFPTMLPGKTLAIFVGTPWVDNDALAYVKATNLFIEVETPVYQDVDGIRVYVNDNFGEAECEAQKILSGEIGFARMYLLDLEAAKGINLKAEWLHEYPASEIRPSWPVVMGVDYAGTMDKKATENDPDSFSLAIMRAIPGGGLVLVDGYTHRLSKGEALERTTAYAAAYPTLKKIGVEVHGEGRGFFSDLLLLRDINGNVPPLHPITHGAKSKGERFENYLGPRFQYSRIWISDAPTPFLIQFKNTWISWPKVKHDDDLDCVYMAAVAGEAWMPTVNTDRQDAHKTQKNPLSAFGRK